jgi:hypothetical protein
MALYDDFIGLPTDEHHSGAIQIPGQVETDVEIQLTEVYKDNSSPDPREESKADTASEDLLYDSVAIHFNVDVFFRQLTVGIIWPFGLLLSPNPRSQLFTSYDLSALWFNHGIQVIFLAMCTSYVMMGRTASYIQFKHFQGSVWYPILFFVLHRVACAIKYASLSRTEYAKLLNKDLSFEQALKFQNQIQV